MTEKPTAIRTAASRTWPGFRYLSLGVWTAWLFLISSGSIWLSDVEFDGTWVAYLMLAVSAVGALFCFIAPLARQRVELLLSKRSLLMAFALLAMMGAVLVILAGPYYFGMPLLYWVGAGLISLFSGVFVLKCGSLFGMLDSKRVLMFSLYSEIVVAVISYFALGNSFYAPIPGGPSLAGILIFALLPPIAAWLVCLPASDAEKETQYTRENENASGRGQGYENGRRHKNGLENSHEYGDSRGPKNGYENGHENGDSRGPKNGYEYSLLIGAGKATESIKYREESEYAASLPLQTWQDSPKSKLLGLPRDFLKFLFMIFFFTLVSETFRYFFVFERPPAFTFSVSMLGLLFRLVFAGVLLFFALRNSSQLRFSRMYQFSLVALAVVLSLIPVLEGYDAILGGVLGLISVCMNLLIWCLLSMIVYEKKLHFLVVFGFGQGALLTARALGWLLGIGVLPQTSGTPWESWCYWGVAILILVATVLFFSELHLDRVFESIAKGKVALDLSQERDEKERRPWLEACKRIGERAMLSQREQEIFELLAIGRSPKNIANHFVVSINTVRSHIRNIYSKLDTHSHEELIAIVEQEIKSQE